MIAKISVVGNGVHLHPLIWEIFVLNLRDQKIDFTDTKLHNQPSSPERLWRAILKACAMFNCLLFLWLFRNAPPPGDRHVESVERVLITSKYWCFFVLCAILRLTILAKGWRMARYKDYLYSQAKFIPIHFSKQILPGIISISKL